MMKKYALLVDMGNCSQCHACMLACKDEHFGNDFPPYTLGIQELGENWINMRIEERGSGSKTRVYCWPEFCRHCEDPDCAKKSNAVSRRADGVVLIDPEKSKDERALVDACPHHAIAWNSEKNLPQKCTLCAHLLDAGEQVPRCVEACPNGSLHFGDLNDPDSEVARLVKEIPELAEQSGVVRYYNLPGKFVAGSVYLSQSEVAEGAGVQLLEDGKLVAQTRTNGFGDFKFDKLPDNKQYQVKISMEGFKPILLTADTAKDVCWDEIMLA
jgi:Fe-S-cluster-containing dehydrogenase component